MIATVVEHFLGSAMASGDFPAIERATFVTPSCNASCVSTLSIDQTDLSCFARVERLRPVKRVRARRRRAPGAASAVTSPRRPPRADVDFPGPRTAHRPGRSACRRSSPDRHRHRCTHLTAATTGLRQRSTLLRQSRMSRIRRRKRSWLRAGSARHSNGLDVGQQREADPRTEILPAPVSRTTRTSLGVGPLEGLCAVRATSRVVHGIGTIGTAQSDLGDMRVVRLRTVQHDLDGVQFGNGQSGRVSERPFPS